MKDNFTRIAVILDRSGSMASCANATIEGFNKFVTGQKQVPGDAKFKLVQFDDLYEPVFDKNMQDVPLLTDKTFIPRGWTALLDAQGKTIVALGEELAAMREEDRPKKVIVVTITDGMENRSTEYTLDRVAEMIKHQSEVYGWEFIFLGANQDAVKTAAKMNINSNAAMSYNTSKAGVGNTYSVLDSHIRMSRLSPRGQSVNFSDEDRVKSMVEDE